MDKHAKIYVAGHRGLVGSALMRNRGAKVEAAIAGSEADAEFVTARPDDRKPRDAV